MCFIKSMGLAQGLPGVPYSFAYAQLVGFKLSLAAPLSKHAILELQECAAQASASYQDFEQLYSSNPAGQNEGRHGGAAGLEANCVTRLH